MISCLGIYIDKDIIKYAKLTRNKKNYTVDSFSVDTYENLEEAVKKIIEETDSYDIPIAINLTDEFYNYFETYSELDKSDIDKALKIEFSKFCEEYNVDENDFVSKYSLYVNRNNNKKLKSIYVSTYESVLEKNSKIFEEYDLSSMTPIGISIANLVEDKEENALIVNLEEETQLSFLRDGRIERVELLSNSINEIIRKIDKDESSLKKSISTLKDIDLFDSDSSRYYDDTLIVLSNICDEIKKLIDKDVYTKVYITGLGATIGNVDICFEDEIGVKCEVLKPFFCDIKTSKYPLKEYIEVNSAISLSIDCLKNINKEINFISHSTLEDIEIDTKISAKEDFEITEWKDLFKAPLNLKEKTLLRIIIFEMIFILIYAVSSRSLMNKALDQKRMVESDIEKSSYQIGLIKQDTETIQKYNKAYEKVMGLNITEAVKVTEKGKIPDLLVKIMYVIPTKVQLKSIKEESDEKTIEIVAISDDEGEITRFVESLKKEDVLTEIDCVNATSGNTIELTIKGKLK